MTLYTLDELKSHMGHKLAVGVYVEGHVEEEATVECETCYEILYSKFKYCQNCKRKMNEFGECPDRCDDR